MSLTFLVFLQMEEYVMAIELEDISLFGLFLKNGKPFIIKDNHFQEINTLRQELEVMPVTYARIQRLGFLRHPDGSYYRQNGTLEFYLQPRKDGNWTLCINKGERIRVITAIHQIQRLWFGMFDDHLFILPDANDARKKPPPTGTFQTKH